MYEDRSSYTDEMRPQQQQQQQQQQQMQRQQQQMQRQQQQMERQQQQMEQQQQQIQQQQQQHQQIQQQQMHEAQTVSRRLGDSGVVDLAQRMRKLVMNNTDPTCADATAGVCLTLIRTSGSTAFLESLLNEMVFFCHTREILISTGEESDGSEEEGAVGGVDLNCLGEGPSHLTTAAELAEAEAAPSPASATALYSFICFATRIYKELRREPVELPENCDLNPLGLILQVLCYCAKECIKQPWCEEQVLGLSAVLHAAGCDMERALPEDASALADGVREMLLSSGAPASVTATLLRLVELRASAWRLSGAARAYYAEVEEDGQESEWELEDDAQNGY